MCSPGYCGTEGRRALPRTAAISFREDGVSACEAIEGECAGVLIAGKCLDVYARRSTHRMKAMLLFVSLVVGRMKEAKWGNLICVWAALPAIHSPKTRVAYDASKYGTPLEIKMPYAVP